MTRHMTRTRLLQLSTITLAATSALFAEQPNDRNRQPQSPEPTYKGPAVEAPQYITEQMAREFSFPNPDRPWGHARQLDPERNNSPRWNRDTGFSRTYRQGGYRRYYNDGYSYRYGTSYGNDYHDDAVERAYRQGMEDGKHYAEFLAQAESGLSAYQRSIASADLNFQRGDYGAAARDYTLAAKLNQGDPISRMNGAHAQVALGRYSDAVALLRRAMELEPRIALMPLDLRAAYGEQKNFNKHLTALRDASHTSADDADLAILLAYYYQFSSNPTAAAEAITRAATLRADDRLLKTLKDAIISTQPATPPEPVKHVNEPAKSSTNKET